MNCVVLSAHKSGILSLYQIWHASTVYRGGVSYAKGSQFERDETLLQINKSFSRADDSKLATCILNVKRTASVGAMANYLEACLPTTNINIESWSLRQCNDLQISRPLWFFPRVADRRPICRRATHVAKDLNQ